MDMEERISKLSKDLGLPVKKILDLFYYLKDGKKVENNELIRKTGIAKNTINSIKESFKDVFGKPSSLTRASKTKIDQLVEIFYSEYLPDENLLKLNLDHKLEKFLNERPKAKREYDQFLATAQTVLKRVAIMRHFADIRGKKIIFLGDDDFTSVSVALAGGAKEILVMDIDARILERINEISKRNSLNISTFKHDLRKALPKNFQDRFDVVFTDPPYTGGGISLFLSRAISSLDRKNNSARIYMCYGNSDRAKEKFLPVIDEIVKSGLMPRYIFDKFNRYNGATSIGSTSSLFILDITPKTKAIIKGNCYEHIYSKN